jgi:hypothetical protein
LRFDWRSIRIGFPRTYPDRRLVRPVVARFPWEAGRCCF